MVSRIRHLASSSVQSSDANTYSLALPENGFLHGLLLTIKATNGATGGRAKSPLDIASNVRVIVDGEVRAFELSPVEIEKWHETYAGYPLTMAHDERAATVQSVVLPITFGRWLEDTEYFLPCSRVKSPKLEVVYAPTIAADGGFATGTVTFDVVGIWSPESDRLNYRGTLVSKTIKAITTVASGDIQTDIDTNELIRCIGVYAYEASIEDGTDVTNVKLRANSGEYDLWDGSWQNLLDVTRYRHWSEIRHSAVLFWQDTDTWNCRLGHVREVATHCYFIDDQAADNFYIRQIKTIVGDLLTLNASIGDITAGAETYVTDATDRVTHVSAKGFSPSYFGVVEYTTNDNESGWLNPADFSKLELLLTQGGADANVRIAVQSLHKF